MEEIKTIEILIF